LSSGAPPRDIDRRNIGFRKGLDALICRFAGHAFGSIRSRIDMTVSTGLIAELADIDLKDRDPGGVKREQADGIELRFEGRTACRSPEYLQLLRGGGEGILLPKQSQRHSILT
jgi:hypothetical protein